MTERRKARISMDPSGSASLKKAAGKVCGPVQGREDRQSQSHESLRRQDW